MGNLPQIGVKMHNIWNHHLVTHPLKNDGLKIPFLLIHFLCRTHPQLLGIQQFWVQQLDFSREQGTFPQHMDQQWCKRLGVRQGCVATEAQEMKMFIAWNLILWQGDQFFNCAIVLLWHHCYFLLHFFVMIAKLSFFRWPAYLCLTHIMRLSQVI